MRKFQIPKEVNYKIKNKKLKKAVIAKMIKLNILQEGAQYLCTGCSEHHLKEYVAIHNAASHDLPSPKKSKHVGHDFLHSLETDTISEDFLLKVYTTLGDKLRNTIYRDTCKTATDYKGVSNLKTFNTSDWLAKRNPKLLAFLSGLLGISWEKSTNQQKLLLARAVEDLYL